MDPAARIISGDRRALARALTLAENEDPAAQDLLAALRGSIGRARRIGFTGPPGAGKSTLVSALLRAARLSGQTAGVLAVDPSSPYSSGALLGDRIRMLEYTLDDGVFIRSQAARGTLGGLSSTAPDMLDILDAAGFDLLFIETVGVGQSELEIVRTADLTVVVLAPGSGDIVQAMKAGLVEAGDLIVINKADLPGADQARGDIIAASALVPGAADRSDCVLLASAQSGLGITELFIRITTWPEELVVARRADQLAHRLDAAVARRLAQLRHRAAAADEFARALVGLNAGTVSFDVAVSRVVAAASGPSSLQPETPS